MSYRVIKKLPTSEQLIKKLPLSDSSRRQIEQDQHEVREILAGNDQRLLMVVGPCSAWPQPAVLEYAKRLAAMNDQVKHALKIIMRVYIQKPRTTRGWTGPVNQPDPFAGPDIEAGAIYSRQMMLKVIDMGLAIADEALFTHNAKGFIELLSWVAVGARSAEDQEHRIFASAIDCPVGIKNPTHGKLAIGVNGIVAAQYPHTAVFDGQEVETSGNPHAHLVLRGGNGQPNYDNQSLLEVKQHMEQHKISNAAVMIDVSHDNCLVAGKKDYQRQPQIIMEVLDNISHHPPLQKLVKGFMVESFLKPGNQKISPQQPDAVDLEGLSITDPCLGWQETEKMLLALAQRVSQ